MKICAYGHSAVRASVRSGSDVGGEDHGSAQATQVLLHQAWQTKLL